jgi:hypothetical protein
MAVFYPSIEKIQTLSVQPEKGELHLLHFLDEVLDDSYEVYFNPFLNGDRPDIIVMRRHYGVLIIEVKDWNFSSYIVDEKKRWKLKSTGSTIKSPVDQVIQYKENMFNLHIEHLLENKIKDFRYWKIVSTAVYFHCETSNTIDDLLISPFEEDYKYLNFLKHNITFLGRDDLNSDDFNDFLLKSYLAGNQQSILFNDSLYKSFLRYLTPVLHTKEDGVPIHYSAKQKELITSCPRHQRIKGVVGSGKTTVLAARAVSAHKRTNDKVLILTFNMTLKNYIHDKMSKVREDFTWNSFYITNYHNFIKAEMNNLGIQIEIPHEFEKFSDSKKSEYFESNYFSNVNLFKDYQRKSRKYKVILIDEIQDYKRAWMDVIKDCFLEEDGEYVVFGDEKQNIYGNELENMDIKTNVVGAPSKLKDWFRPSPSIHRVIENFQEQLFEAKYEKDDFKNQLQFNFENKGSVRYIQVPVEEGLDTIYRIIYDTSLQLNEHPNNIAVLGFTISLLRELDCYYRYKTNEKTNAMFETQEVWYKLLIDSWKGSDLIQQGVRFFNRNISRKDKEIQLSIALTLKLLVNQFEDEVFHRRLADLFSQYNIDPNQFNDWYEKQELNQILNGQTPAKMYSMVKAVRDNKKMHFWNNSGTMKFSTIHSFKGWESNTLFLILEPRFQNGEFNMSFDELIYTGITRSKSNLIIINHGNTDYHKELERVIRIDNPY